MIIVNSYSIGIDKLYNISMILKDINISSYITSACFSFSIIAVNKRPHHCVCLVRYKASLSIVCLCSSKEMVHDALL